VHPPPSPARTDFTLITECTPESSGCNSVYSVVMTIKNQKGRESTPYVPLILKGSFIYVDRLLNNGIHTVFCTLAAMIRTT
jgi:hypothetical protein